MEEEKDSFPMDPSTPKQIPSEEAEDSSPVSIIHKKIPSEEAEESPSKFSVNHMKSRRFFPSGSHIYTTPCERPRPRPPFL